QEFFIKEQQLRVFLLIVFGAVGTLARYGLQGLIQKRAGSEFPYGTLAVNLSGCLLLGLIGQYALRRLTIPPDWRVGITIGFFGAFTTFSTFGWETVRLLEDGEWRSALLYATASLIGGILAVKAGMHIAERI